METSLLIARIFAVLYLAVGLGLLLQRDFYLKMMQEMLNNSVVMFFGGAMALVTGMLIIHFHNSWDLNWAVLVTLIGWLALIKGITILVFPSLMISISQSIISNNKLMAIWPFLAIALAMLLGYFGFIG